MAKTGDQLVRNTARKIGIVSVIGGLLALLLVLTIVMPSQSAPYRAAQGATGYPTNLNGIANSCSDTGRWMPSLDQYGIIPNNFYARYKKSSQLPVPVAPMTIPVYGYMSRDVIPRADIKFYDAQDDPKYAPWDVLRAVYTYDTLVIWYMPTTDPDAIAQIKKYAAGHANVLALPWTYTDQIDRGKDFAFSSWGMTQICQTYSDDVADDFRQFIKRNRVARANPAPVAKMTQYGVLPSLALREDN